MSAAVIAGGYKTSKVSENFTHKVWIHEMR